MESTSGFLNHYLEVSLDKIMVPRLVTNSKFMTINTSTISEIIAEIPSVQRVFPLASEISDGLDLVFQLS